MFLAEDSFSIFSLLPQNSWKCRNGTCLTNTDTTLTSARESLLFGRPAILTVLLKRPVHAEDFNQKLDPPICVTVPSELKIHPQDTVVYRPYACAQHHGQHRSTGHVTLQIWSQTQPGMIFYADDAEVCLANEEHLRKSEANGEMYFFVRSAEFDESLPEFNVPTSEDSDGFLCGSLTASEEVSITTSTDFLTS